MNFTERCALCQKLRDGYDAELLGLWQAQADQQAGFQRWGVGFKNDPDRQARFEQGYREGREILLLEKALDTPQEKP